MTDKLKLKDVAIAHSALSSILKQNKLDYEKEFEALDLIDCLEKNANRLYDGIDKIASELGGEKTYNPFYKRGYIFREDKDEKGDVIKTVKEKEKEFDQQSEKLGDTLVTVTWEKLPFDLLKGTQVDINELQPLRKYFIERPPEKEKNPPKNENGQDNKTKKDKKISP